MSNMAYCRFQNTLPDLRDCLEHLWDDDLSDEERTARRRLAKVCKDLADEWEEDGE